MKSLLFCAFVPCGLLVDGTGPVRSGMHPAGIEENDIVDTPERIILLSSRHNPFAISTHIFFGFPRAAHIS